MFSGSHVAKYSQRLSTQMGNIQQKDNIQRHPDPLPSAAQSSETATSCLIASPSNSAFPSSNSFRWTCPTQNIDVGFNAEGFRLGTLCAQRVLFSPLYAQSITTHFPHLLASDISSFIASSPIIFKVIELRQDMDAFALVYRGTEPQTIYFNPILLRQIACRESECPQDELVKAKHATFVLKLICHEVAHLINWALNATELAANGGVTPQKLIGGAIFDDIGNMIEVGLFGGVCELSEQTTSQLFGVDDVVVYSYPGASDGFVAVNYCQYTSSIANGTQPLSRATLLIPTGAVHKKRRRKRTLFASRASDPERRHLVFYETSSSEEEEPGSVATKRLVARR